MYNRHPADTRLRVRTDSARKRAPLIRVALILSALRASKLPRKRAPPTRLRTQGQVPPKRALDRLRIVCTLGGHPQELRPGGLWVAHALPSRPTRPGDRPGPTKRHYSSAPCMLDSEMPLLDGSDNPKDGREDLKPAGLPADSRRRNPTPSGRGRRHNVGTKVAEKIVLGDHARSRLTRDPNPETYPGGSQKEKSRISEVHEVTTG